jgi:4a-hydroxytetrahydrobiopterin dehydratase
MREKLDEAAIGARLQALAAWHRDGETIVREVTCRDFRSALAFVNTTGELAEAADHHPDILIHGWNRVRIMLSTHSAGGLTERDFELAAQIEPLAHRYETQ